MSVSVQQNSYTIEEPNGPVTVCAIRTLDGITLERNVLVSVATAETPSTQGRYSCMMVAAPDVAHRDYSWFMVVLFILYLDPEDFIGIAQDLTFQPGQSLACVNIVIINDIVPENTEFFVFSIPLEQDDPAVNVIADANAAVVIITDPEDGKF